LPKTNVLLLGHFFEGSSHSVSVSQYARAIASQPDVNLVCRSVTLTENPTDPDSDIDKLLAKPHPEQYDYCIQHVLPLCFEYSGEFKKTVGLFFTECSSIKFSGWVDKINMVDEAWVACSSSVECLKNSGVTVPSKVIPIPLDHTLYSRKQPKVKLKGDLGNPFIFLTVGAFVRRKNFHAILTAYHLEFGPEEPVQLVLKTNGKSMDYVRGFCNQIKAGLRIYPRIEDYHSEVVILDRLSDSDLLALHASADAYLGISSAEGFDIPAFQSLCLGVPTILSQNSSHLDYGHEYNCWFVPCTEQPVTGVEDQLTNLFTGRENWWPVSIPELRKAMRAVYDGAKKPYDNLKIAEEFSYENVGRLILEELRR
jgi:glycosyltransferase involved in cell wall biosynthesis